MLDPRIRAVIALVALLTAQPAAAQILVFGSGYEQCLSVDAPPAQVVYVVGFPDYEALLSFDDCSEQQYGCRANVSFPLDAALTNVLDASLSVDPRRCPGADPAPSYHWAVFTPISHGGDFVATRGMSPAHRSVLNLRPDSLPNLPAIEGDPMSQTWRIRLTITHRPYDPNATTPQVTEKWIFLRYLGSRLSQQMYQACQSNQPPPMCTEDSARPPYPEVYTESAVAQFVSGAGAVTAAPAIDVYDGLTQGSQLLGATVQIAGGLAPSQDSLSFVSANGIVGTYDPPSGTLTLSGGGFNSVGQYQTALRSVAYNNSAGSPSTAPRTLTWRARNEHGLSPPATSTITFAGAGP